MNKYDIKFIFKRVLTFFIIFVIMSLIHSCDVHAESYSVENSNTVAIFYPSGSNSNLLWSTLYYKDTPNIVLSGWDFNMYMPSSTTGNILFNGRYLFSYYLFGVGTFRNLTCNEITSNFKNINKTTGNQVSNEITSKCVDIYRTTYHGYNAYRILYEFTYTSKTGPDGIDELTFSFFSGYNPIVAGSTGMNYGFEINNISDYDINTINTWNTDKQQQTIINQNEQINNSINTSTQTIINQNNTNTNSIINNQNTNTNSIINNQNTNSQNEINNSNTNSQNEINAANQNTDREIESQNVCSKYDKNSIELKNKYLTSDGSERTSSSSFYGISKYIKINSSSKITVLVKYNENDYACFYNVNKELISCLNQRDYNSGDIYPIPDNASYFRYSINTNTNRPQLEICTNGNQAITNSIDDLNDNINDDNVDGASSEVDDLLQNEAFNDSSGIQSIINAPLNFINGLTNSCSPISINIPYIDENLTIPCIKQELSNHVPNLVSILSTAINGFVIYRILIDIVYLIKSSRNPDDDRIEVLDL